MHQSLSYIFNNDYMLTNLEVLLIVKLGPFCLKLSVKRSIKSGLGDLLYPFLEII